MTVKKRDETPDAYFESPDHRRPTLELPLDKATATADLLSDLFPPSLCGLDPASRPGARFWQMTTVELEALASTFDLTWPKLPSG